MKSRIFALLVIGATAIGMAGWVGCSSESEATTVEVKLSTMQCSMCSNTIEEALKKVDGVQSVEVNLDAKTAKVTFDDKVTNVPALEQAVVKTGYAANDKKADADAYAKLPSCCQVPEQ